MEVLIFRRGFSAAIIFCNFLTHQQQPFNTDYFFRLIPQDLYYIALRISVYYGCSYQIVFGVHTDTEKIHIHFIMNTVSFIDGTMYSGNETDMDYCTRYNK